MEVAFHSVIAILLVLILLEVRKMSSTPDPLTDVIAKEDEILSNQALAQQASATLIADVEKLLGQPTPSGQVLVSKDELAAMLVKLNTINDHVTSQTAAETAEDSKVNPAPPVTQSPTGGSQ